MQQDLQFQIDMHAAGLRLLDALTTTPIRWMPKSELVARTGMDDRHIRQVIVDHLRPAGHKIISGKQGYKLAETDEEIERFNRWMMKRAETGVLNFARVRGISFNEALNEIRSKRIAEALSN